MSIADRYESLRRAYDPERVGRRIRALRIVWEISQSEMARHMGVVPHAISQVESGIYRPSADLEVRIKAAFGVTTDWIKFGDIVGIPSDLARRLAKALHLLESGKIAVRSKTRGPAPVATLKTPTRKASARQKK